MAGYSCFSVCTILHKMVSRASPSRRPTTLHEAERWVTVPRAEREKLGAAPGQNAAGIPSVWWRGHHRALPLRFTLKTRPCARRARSRTGDDVRAKSTRYGTMTVWWTSLRTTGPASERVASWSTWGSAASAHSPREPDTLGSHQATIPRSPRRSRRSRLRGSSIRLQSCHLSEVDLRRTRQPWVPRRGLSASARAWTACTFSRHRSTSMTCSSFSSPTGPPTRKRAFVSDVPPICSSVSRWPKHGRAQRAAAPRPRRQPCTSRTAARANGDSTRRRRNPVGLDNASARSYSSSAARGVVTSGVVGHRPTDVRRYTRHPFW